MPKTWKGLRTQGKHEKFYLEQCDNPDKVSRPSHSGGR